MTAALEAELRMCAVHESAHAVLASSFGWTVKELVLHQPGDRATAGGVAGYCQIADQGDVIDESPLKFLTYLCAAALAERAAGGRPSARDGYDRRQAEALALLLCGTDTPTPRSDGLLRTAEAIAATRLLDDLAWQWIENVAGALLQRRRLTGVDVHALHPRGVR